MREECKLLFLKSHPEFKRMKLSDEFMFNKLKEFYLNAENIMKKH